MSAHASTDGALNRPKTDSEDNLPTKGELLRLIEAHPAFQHRANIGGVEFAEFSTVQTDADGYPYITDMGNHIRLYLGGDVVNVILTDEQVEHEETGMEGERNAAPFTKSLVCGHELHSDRDMLNTSRNYRSYTLENGRPIILSFRRIPEDERASLVER
jgi:hypothetical protein